VVRQVRDVVASVPAELLAYRARSALSVDVTPELARCTMPILYLRGSKDHVVHERSVEAIVRAASVPVSVAHITARHLLLKTAPHEAWRAIGEFLAAQSQNRLAIPANE
jgi:fermentation-respiration switch protein FrsA (DUF1100 family)